MRLFLLTALTMCAFAANSVLNRLAVHGNAMDPLDFAAVRLASGAVALAVLARAGGRGMVFSGRLRLTGAAALLTYMLGFSLAYLALGAGVGALILFGGVQITMFAGAVLGGEAVPVRRWAGAGLALAGLAWLLWPGIGAEGVNAPAALSMAAAAMGWGVYSLAGRREADPMAATAANFVLAAPCAILPALVWPAGSGAGPGLAGPGLAGPGLAGVGLAGVGLAVLSGVVTSGLGYALWYAVVQHLGATRAAVAQLTVPVIAALGGLAVLGEWPGPGFWLAAALVLGGVGLSVCPARPGRA